ncbi:hypothetical protein KEJ15_03195 [Candidatus Bathyarchaeota archaeon]|nr:hypothetical protein [Candidatus Bathyarchaeota archaeon]
MSLIIIGGELTIGVFFWIAEIYSTNPNVGNLPITTAILAICAFTVNYLIITQLYKNSKMDEILIVSYASFTIQ